MVLRPSVLSVYLPLDACPCNCVFAASNVQRPTVVFGEFVTTSLSWFLAIFVDVINTSQHWKYYSGNWLLYNNIAQHFQDTIVTITSSHSKCKHVLTGGSLSSFEHHISMLTFNTNKLRHIHVWQQVSHHCSFKGWWLEAFQIKLKQTW